MVLNYNLGKAKSKTLKFFLCAFASLREKKDNHKVRKEDTKPTKKRSILLLDIAWLRSMVLNYDLGIVISKTQIFFLCVCYVKCQSFFWSLKFYVMIYSGLLASIWNLNYLLYVASLWDHTHWLFRIDSFESLTLFESSFWHKPRRLKRKTFQISNYIYS